MKNFEYDPSLLGSEQGLRDMNEEIQARLIEGCQTRSLSADLVEELIEFYDSGVVQFSFGEGSVFEDALGGVDLNDPTRVYLTKRFFSADEEEQIRTVIHEITHVLGWTHPDSKSHPDYFKSPALLAEKCLTGRATFRKMDVKATTCEVRNRYRVIMP